jgi:predicted O-methyltransferase YrrM
MSSDQSLTTDVLVLQNQIAEKKKEIQDLSAQLWYKKRELETLSANLASRNDTRRTWSLLSILAHIRHWLLSQCSTCGRILSQISSMRRSETHQTNDETEAYNKSHSPNKSPANLKAESEVDEIAHLVSLGQKYLQQGSEIKAKLEVNGIQLINSNYYSPIPTVKEIDASWELRDEAMPYLEPDLYDNEFMLSFLTNCLAPYANDFNPFADVTDSPAEFYWRNPQFSYTDALAYYCLIRYQKPQRIIEIGAGYSSLIASQGLQDNDLGELILIEPYPSERLKLALESHLISPKPTTIQKRVQDVPVSFFADNLNENDILFIDSTHTVKAGGDCIYIYLKILPQLRNGVIIHSHDIYLPQMMPAHWLKEFDLYWTEQYLLQAYLLDNQHIEILYGSQYHYLLNRKALEAFMNNKYTIGGNSFWFKKI